MATADREGTRRLGGGWLLDLWNDASTQTRLALAGISLALLLGLVGLLLTARTTRVVTVPLLSGHRFSPNESRLALQAFSQKSLRDFEYAGGQIFVPRDKENAYLQALADGDAFPDNLYKALDDYVINQRNWWASQADAERLLKIAREKMLSKTLLSMEGVTNASVLVTEPPRLGMRRVGKAKGSVSVTVVKPLGATRIEQIKHLVASAVHDLAPEDVYVAVNGTGGGGSASGGSSGVHAVDTELAKMKSEYLQTKEAYAEAFEADIRRIFSDMEGIDVIANVELTNNDGIQQHIVSYQKGAVASQETTSRVSEQGSGADAGGEPGVRTNADLPGTPPAGQRGASNQGAVVGVASAAGNSDSEETSSLRFDNNKVETSQKIHGLLPTKVGVVIKVPRKLLDPSTDADGRPTPPARTEADMIEAVVRLGLPGLTAENVKIDRYQPTLATEPEVVRASVVEVLKEGGPLILFAVLGLAAIATALIVGRRAPMPPLPPMPDDATESAEKDADSLLPKIPLDETALRADRMRGEIAQMATQNPEAAASLIRRWLQNE